MTLLAISWSSFLAGDGFQFEMLERAAWKKAEFLFKKLISEKYEWILKIAF